MKKERPCTQCNNIATSQTAKGKSNQESGGLPQNDGWYCEDCYRKGLDIENEAMYGECLNNCKC